MSAPRDDKPISLRSPDEQLEYVRSLVDELEDLGVRLRVGLHALATTQNQGDLDD